MTAIIQSLDPANKIVPKDGDSLLFEIFSRAGKEYVKVTLEGKPVRINGDAAGSIEINSFWDYIYLRTYPGDEQSVCNGVENPEAYTRFRYPNFVEYAKS